LKKVKILDKHPLHPPRLALGLFKLFAGREHFDFAVGDLEEKFAVLAREMDAARVRR
jgi:hypothetical protein